MSPVFSVKAASKTYGAHKALDRLELTVEKGEFVALIGPSGSGKSTLLRTLNGLIRIDSDDGRVEVFGLALQSRGGLSRERRRIRSRIGFIFQQFNLVGRLSLYSNVMLGALARMPAWRGVLGAWSRTDQDRALDALGRVGVLEFAGQRANTLSGGQQQRGAIARALTQGAEAILADEPVASLDLVSSRRVMEILQRLNEDDGLTVIVTLHQVDHAVRYCRRIVALKAGRVVYDGTPSGLDHALLKEIYGSEVEDVLPAAALGALA